MQEKIRGKARIAEELGKGKCFFFFLKNANEIIIMDVCSSSIKKDD